MRILFASAHPYLPEIVGGSQVNTHELAKALIARGHDVAVLAGLAGMGWTGLKSRVALKLGSGGTASGTWDGYRVYRAWSGWEGAARAVDAFRPDVAIAQSGAILRMAVALRAGGVPTVIYNHNVEFDDHGADMADVADAPFLANSRFTADRYKAAYGVRSDVIAPLFDKSRYLVTSSREEVLFINPHPQKGVDTAIALARSCPEIPFRFVRAWSLSPSDEKRLQEGIGPLRNVKLSPATNAVREHFARARVLLVPSVWAETWGRVATEAQFSGLPVLATRIGGLPEAVGPGGVLVDPGAPAETWSEALRALWFDPARYDGLAAAALTYSVRDEINPALQISRLEAVMARAVASPPGTRTR